jgi:hypothetical protein
MKRSPRPLIAGLVVAAGLAIGGPTTPVAAQSVPLFPAGVVSVPIVGVAGSVVSPIVVVPPLGIGTQHAHVDQDRSRSRERGAITIGGA